MNNCEEKQTKVICDKKFEYARDYLGHSYGSQRQLLVWFIGINGALFAFLRSEKGPDWVTILGLFLVNLILTLYYVRQHYLNEKISEKLKAYKILEKGDDKLTGLGWFIVRISLLMPIALLTIISFVDCCIYVGIFGVIYLLVMMYFLFAHYPNSIEKIWAKIKTSSDL